MGTASQPQEAAVREAAAAPTSRIGGRATRCGCTQWFHNGVRQALALHHLVVPERLAGYSEEVVTTAFALARVHKGQGQSPGPKKYYVVSPKTPTDPFHILGALPCKEAPEVPEEDSAEPFQFSRLTLADRYEQRKEEEFPEREGNLASCTASTTPGRPIQFLDADRFVTISIACVYCSAINVQGIVECATCSFMINQASLGQQEIKDAVETRDEYIQSLGIEVKSQGGGRGRAGTQKRNFKKLLIEANKAGYTMDELAAEFGWDTQVRVT